MPILLFILFIAGPQAFSTNFPFSYQVEQTDSNQAEEESKEDSVEYLASAPYLLCETRTKKIFNTSHMTAIISPFLDSFTPPPDCCFGSLSRSLIVNDSLYTLYNPQLIRNEKHKYSIHWILLRYHSIRIHKRKSRKTHTYLPRSYSHRCCFKA